MMPTIPPSPLAAALKAARERRELTLRELGSRTSIGFRHIHSYERGLVPSPAHLRRLCAALNVRPEELLLGAIRC